MITKVFITGLLVLLLCEGVYAEFIDEYGVGFNSSKVTEYLTYYDTVTRDRYIYFLVESAGVHNMSFTTLTSETGFHDALFKIETMDSDKNFVERASCSSPYNTLATCNYSGEVLYNIIRVRFSGSYTYSFCSVYKNSTITPFGSEVVGYNFTEGGSAVLPFVSKYDPSFTMAFDESDTSISSPINSTAFFWADATFSCDIDGNSTTVVVYDADPFTLLDYQFYSYPVNIVQYPDLNISFTSHAPNSTIYTGFDENVTFSSVINNPEVVSYFVYSVDGVVVASDTSEFTWDFSSSVAGNYTIQKSYIDTCGQLPFVKWNVIVGNTIELSGTITGHDYEGNYVPLFPATVMLSDGSSSWFTYTESTAGDYHFSGLAEGSYNISASASGYNSSTDSLSMSYLPFQNPTLYSHDMTLEYSGEGGASCFSVLSEGGLDQVYLWDFSFYWEGILVLSISNDSVTYDIYPDRFNASFNTHNDSFICISDIPVGYNYTYVISKEGYVTPEGYAVDEFTYPVEVPANILTDWFAIELVSNESGGTVWGSTELILSFPDYTSDDVLELVEASYTDSGVLITGASCTYFSSAVDPSSGVLEEYYDMYANWVNVEGVGNFSISATCSKSGYPTLTASKSFMSLGEFYTSVDWVSAPLQVTLGDSATFTVKFRAVSGGYGIDGGACTLVFNGTAYDMSVLSGYQGKYYYTYSIPAEGVYQYSVNCSKASFTSSVSSTRTVSVSSEGIPPPLPSHCLNGYLDFDETDVDCGGLDCDPCDLFQGCILDSDCISGYCANGICRSPSCSDGVMNGDETGTDCGGSCPPCACFYDWDCALDGSQHCEGNECLTDNCSTNSDCPPLLWYNPIDAYYSRDRGCYDGLCGFLFMNETFNLSFQLTPLVEYRVWIDSGRVVYLFYCEDNSNGFTIVTSNPSRKWFFYSDPVSYSPYVPPSDNLIFGSQTFERETSDFLDDLCLLNSSQNRTYALVTFYVADGSSLSQQRSVYILSFRNLFSVSASKLTDDVILLNLTRPGLCFYRQSNADSWSSINAVEALNITWGASTTEGYDIFCNNSFGEEALTDFNAGSREIFLFVFDVLWLLLAGLWFAVVGSAFTWQSWYILPLAILVLFTLPTLIIIFLSSRYHKNEK